MTPLVIVNVVLALGSAAFGVLALARPALLAGSAADAPAAVFFARMYASRAVPFGVALALVLVLGPSHAAEWLAAAAVIQGLDAAIGASRGSLGMTLAPAVTALIHGGTALAMVLA